jgi:hypothetical protein
MFVVMLTLIIINQTVVTLFELGFYTLRGVVKKLLRWKSKYAEQSIACHCYWLL